jgi:hypothetical protein
MGKYIIGIEQLVMGAKNVFGIYRCLGLYRYWGILLVEVGVISGEWLAKGLETPYQRIGNRKG